jgi:hypothetical protein
VPEHLRIPRPLRELHEFAGALPRLCAQNRLLPPDELGRDDGRLVFYIENQGVDWWATDLSADDPPVWVRGDEPRAEWELEGEPLSRFLAQVVVFEAIFGADHGASALLEESELSAALAPLSPLPFGPWRWPAYPTRFYRGDRLLAVTWPAYEDVVDVWIGGRDEEAVAYLDGVADDWEYYSRRDGVLK